MNFNMKANAFLHFLYFSFVTSYFAMCLHTCHFIF